MASILTAKEIGADFARSIARTAYDRTIASYARTFLSKVSRAVGAVCPAQYSQLVGASLVAPIAQSARPMAFAQSVCSQHGSPPVESALMQSAVLAHFSTEILVKSAPRVAKPAEVRMSAMYANLCTRRIVVGDVIYALCFPTASSAIRSLACAAKQILASIR